MKYLALTLLTSLFFITSCKKKDLDFKFSGTLKDSNSGLAIPNVEIKFYTYSLGNNVESLKASIKTDASGNYETVVERSKFENLVIKIRKQNYFDIDKTYSISELTTSKSNEKNYSMSPQSWTKFILKNLSPASSNDELKIQKISGKTDCADCCANETTFYYGNVNTVVYCPNDGGSNMKFYWWVNGIEMSGEENIYNAPFDTVSVTIEY